MKIVFRLVLLFSIIVMTAAVAMAQKNGPRMPFVDKGACPFECCTYREWTVDKPTAMHRDMSDGSPIVFRLAKGEKVTGVTGTVITPRAGIARVLKRTTIDKITLNRGDNIYLLTYLGEGFSKAWFRGRIFEVEVLDDKVFKVTRRPTEVWWVKVKNRRGQIGWSRQPDNFGNKDQCGG